jgi:thioredoxin-dependent peroxiredoxin
MEVFGISKDTVKKQFNFANKLETPFSLLSDIDGIVCEKFGVWQEKKFMGKTSMGIVRSTFILDENNEVVKEWRGVKVKGHVEEVLEACKG